MKELLNDIDELLAHFEDFTHGEDGKKITEMRVKIAAQLKDIEKFEKLYNEDFLTLSFSLDFATYYLRYARLHLAFDNIIERMKRKEKKKKNERNDNNRV